MKKRILVLMLVFTMVTAFVPCIHAATIVESGECGADGNNVTWTLDSDGTLTISGTGDMKDYDAYFTKSNNGLTIAGQSNEFASWCYYQEDIKNIIIEYGVTSIGDRAFSNFISLENISIPNSITNINSNSFKNCTSLKNINIPGSVVGIGVNQYTSKVNNPFIGCSSLESITVSTDNNKYTAVDGVLFSKDMTKLILYPAGNKQTSYSIPDTVIEIGDSSFYNCSSLEYIKIPNSVMKIGTDAFYGCSSLKNIIIPGNVKSFDKILENCTSLENIVLLEGLEVIGHPYFGYGVGLSFKNCTSLKSIEIPRTVFYIDADSFEGCMNLTDIYYGGSEEAWNNIKKNIPDNIAIHYNASPLSTDITVTVNGVKVEFDQSPIIVDNRTLVPLRAIFEALGATVDWDGSTQTVTSERNNTIIKVTIGNNIIQRNNENIELDVPAQIINDRTLVPARAVAEAFGCYVDWNGETKTVIITQ